MKNFAVKILAGCVCAGLCLAGLAGCGTEDKAPDIEVTTFPLPDGPEQSEIQVEPIPDISDDFIRGMDASSVLVNERSGVVYYGFEGQEQDVFMTMAQAGVNYIRLRVWNDPYDEDGHGYGGGNNDSGDVVEGHGEP